MTATVLGVTGYAGSLLLRLLLDHPQVSAIIPVSGSRAGEPLAAALPGFADVASNKIGDGRLSSAAAAARHATDVVFSSLPPLSSAAGAAPWFDSAVVIDLAADFRIKDHALFASAYGSPPPRPDLLPRAVYGLSEWHRGAIGDAPIIANPGCYPTAVLLPVLPLAAAGLLCGCVIATAMSGITGAGRKVAEQYLFTELSENLTAYAPGRSHRHHSEMVSELHAVAEDLDLLFTPHLVPMRRGLAATTVVTLRETALESAVAETLEQAYGGAPFVKLTGERIPATADVWGANRCDIGWRVSGRQLVLFSVIDNLVKGAAGQAVQNMNLRFGLPETSGLPLHAEA
jgi:N-acetyl-gamma-glutamyl-phosphate reductase